MSHSLGSDDVFVTTMRAGLNSARKGLNVASSSKAIGKKSGRSQKRPVGDPEARALLGGLVASIESKSSSRATSSSASQNPATPTTLQQCTAIVKEIDLDDDTIMIFLEAIGWFPHMQQLFLDMTTTQRVGFVMRTITSRTNQTTQPSTMAHPSMASNFMQPPIYQNFMPTPNFYQQPPFYGQQPPTFGQPQVPNFSQPPHHVQPQHPPGQNMTPNITSHPLNFQYPPPYYMPSFPPNSGNFGGGNNEE